MELLKDCPRVGQDMGITELQLFYRFLSKKTGCPSLLPSFRRTRDYEESSVTIMAVLTMVIATTKVICTSLIMNTGVMADTRLMAESHGDGLTYGHGHYRDGLVWWHGHCQEYCQDCRVGEYLRYSI